MTSVDGIENDLTEHGLAFLARSISSFRDEASTKGPLFAVVDVAVAIEALLKARLAREHWSLLLSDPDRSTTTKFRSGQAITVAPAKVISRLKNIAGVELLARTADIEEVLALRNRTLHFTVPDDLDSIGVTATYGRALNAALSILESEFLDFPDPQLKRQITGIVGNLMDEVGEIDSLVDDRMHSIEDRLSKADFCLECPRCRQRALIFSAGSGEVACAFCLWNPESPEAAASEYLTTILDHSEYVTISNGDPWPVWECPECDHRSAISVIQTDRPRRSIRTAETSPPDWFYACFGCAWHGSGSQFHTCLLCETKLTDGEALCHACQSDRIDLEWGELADRE